MTNNTVIAFQPVSKTAPLSETARAAINKTVLQFYVQNQPQDDTAEGITALYERLSQEDGQEGESNSIANQKKILERYARDHGYTVSGTMRTTDTAVQTSTPRLSGNACRRKGGKDKPRYCQGYVALWA